MSNNPCTSPPWRMLGPVLVLTALVCGIVAGLAGYKYGSQPSQPVIIINLAPSR